MEKKTNLVFIPIHSSEGTNMRKNVLQRISKLEGIDIPQSELDMRIDDEFRKTQDFTTEMERISESRLFPLLCC